MVVGWEEETQRIIKYSVSVIATLHMGQYALATILFSRIGKSSEINSDFMTIYFTILAWMNICPSKEVLDIKVRYCWVCSTCWYIEAG